LDFITESCKLIEPIHDLSSFAVELIDKGLELNEKKNESTLKYFKARFLVLRSDMKVARALVADLEHNYHYKESVIRNEFCSQAREFLAANFKENIFSNLLNELSKKKNTQKNGVKRYLISQK